MSEIKRRKDSFWGIHCDFHARPWMGVMGRTLREEDIRKVCRELKPDFWQIDCKGHFGWASYPSSLGNAMPEFAFDTLQMFRRVTREEGVALYLHYSGVWDDKYCSEHPEDAVMRADGTLDGASTYRNGNYVENLLIPQLSELAEKYEVDGIWLDGECWASRIDYHPRTLADFQRETGIDLGGEVPTKHGDKYFEEYRAYNRELFRRYVRHYTKVLHEKYPWLQLTSNWIFSDHMPEEVTADVDFLSGDNMPIHTLQSARYTARYMPQQKMPWDIMGMAQNGHIDILPMHPTQVLQQAAAVISLGGAFQAGMSFLFDGSPNMVTLLNLKPVAEFMRAREAFCFKGVPIPQVAMLLSTYDRHLEGEQLFERGDISGKRGLVGLLCDCGQSVEVISEHSLRENINRFPLLIVPEIIEGLAPQTVRQLLDYAENGGSLMLVGEKTCRIFAENGAQFAALEMDDPVPTEKFLCQQYEAKDERFWVTDGKFVGGVLAPFCQILPMESGEVVAQTCYSVTSERRNLAVVMPFGKGKIAAIGANIGTAYDTMQQFLHRDLMKKLTEKLYTPLARVEEALGFLELVCLEKDGHLMLQLVNGNGNHNNNTCATEDFIPPVLDIRLSVQVAQKPQKLVLQPEGKELAFELIGDRVYFNIDRLDIHSIVEVVI